MSAYERSGWRDEAISRKHRHWGFNCPCVDIDLLAIEYDIGTASGIVEYKNEHANAFTPDNPSYKALVGLGNKAELPVFVCRYTDDLKKYTAVPLNEHASIYLPKRTEMSEEEWVELLYKFRGREKPKYLFDSEEIRI
jgi:hypothetical protein